ncbi:MAG: hypothetical protein ACRDYY_14035, partial [Acidimicrobiales bacterium]
MVSATKTKAHRPRWATGHEATAERLRRTRGPAARAAAGPLAVAALAAALVATGEALGWRGVDLPAQLH